MSWQPGLEITLNPETLSYKVYLDDGSGNNPVVFWDSAGHSVSTVATLSGLRTGTVYSAHVTATNVIGESSKSAPLTINTGMVPSQITSLRWQSSTSTSITFEWELPESNGGLSLLSFTIYVDVGRTGGTPTVIEITDTFKRSHTLDSLATGAFVDI